MPSSNSTILMHSKLFFVKIVTSQFWILPLQKNQLGFYVMQILVLDFEVCGSEIGFIETLFNKTCGHQYKAIWIPLREAKNFSSSQQPLHGRRISCILVCVLCNPTMIIELQFYHVSSSSFIRYSHFIMNEVDSSSNVIYFININVLVQVIFFVSFFHGSIHINVLSQYLSYHTLLVVFFIL